MHKLRIQMILLLLAVLTTSHVAALYGVFHHHVEDESCACQHLDQHARESGTSLTVPVDADCDTAPCHICGMMNGLLRSKGSEAVRRDTTNNQETPCVYPLTFSRPWATNGFEATIFPRRRLLDRRPIHLSSVIIRC